MNRSLRLHLPLAGIWLGLTSAPAATLAPEEQKIIAYIDAHAAGFAPELARLVEIDSPTENLSGVRQMGEYFVREFAPLGFEAHFVPLPAATKRAGHFVATRTGLHGKRLLLIGHLDTVLPGGKFNREGDRAIGSGAGDMKGGDLVLLQALRALHSVGALDGTTLNVIMTGDEEDPGEPMDISRRDLREAAARSDLALGFENAIGTTATVARRGIVSWSLEVQGATGHSSGIFSAAAGGGAVYEAARILMAFYEQLRSMDGITCNPALLTGGTEADIVTTKATAFGKTNIIAQRTLVKGDLRYLSAEQLTEAKARMQAIVSKGLPRTSAILTFENDGYPAMAPAPGNYALLAQLDQVSRDLGFGEVKPFDPKGRGAGDISIVAPPLPGLDGLGLRGEGAHTPHEYADLASAPELTKRTALLIYRLTR
ncbi:MAG: M20/M25/M40 family metallo-hydrolase [Opitutae bacterium]